MSDAEQKTPRSRGRPRTFKEDEALDKAIGLFRKKGLDGTTIGELSTVMGLNKPSIYGAFGDRNAVYQRAIERYGDLVAADWARAVKKASSAPEAAELFLKAAMNWFSPDDDPTAGCLVISTMPASAFDEAVRASLARFLKRADTELTDYFHDTFMAPAGQPRSRAAVLALLVNSCVQSMAVRAKSGADRKALWKAAQATLDAIEALCRDG